MTRLFASLLAASLCAAQLPVLSAQTSRAGVITGIVVGTAGALTGVTVQVLDSAGVIVGSTVTTETGAFRVNGLPEGTFPLNAVSTSGAVIGTSIATLTADAMTARVTISATAASDEAAAMAAWGGLAVPAIGLSARTVVASLGAAAANIGAASLVVVGADASPSR